MGRERESSVVGKQLMLAVLVKLGFVKAVAVNPYI